MVSSVATDFVHRTVCLMSEWYEGITIKIKHISDFLVFILFN